MANYDINTILSQWSERVIERIGENLDNTNTTASGRTKESLAYELTDDGVVIYGRDYIRGVELGRPSGKIPYNMTDIISQWIIDKGLESHFEIERPSQLRSVAYLIGQKIKREGTELYRKGGREDIYTNVANEEIETLSDMLSEDIQMRINNTIEGFTNG